MPDDTLPEAKKERDRTHMHHYREMYYEENLNSDMSGIRLKKFFWIPFILIYNVYEYLM